MTLADLAQYVVLPVLGISLLLALTRLLRGPRMPDRIVALVLALISFLGTTAFAYYLQRRPEA